MKPTGSVLHLQRFPKIPTQSQIHRPFHTDIFFSKIDSNGFFPTILGLDLIHISLTVDILKYFLTSHMSCLNTTF